MTDVQGVSSTENRERANGADPSPPPHSIESEQWVLGGLLQDPSTWAEVAEVIRGADDFYRNDHRVIFRALAQLASAGNSFDVVLVLEQLRGDAQLEAAGGLAYLGTLARETATVANIRKHAETVAERARLRRLRNLGNSIESAIDEGFTSGQIANSLQSVLEQMPRSATQPAPTAPVTWSRFVGDPPPRTWWLPEWLAPDPTFVAGAGGTGKTRLWQAIGTSLATGAAYLAPVSAPLRVLMWSCEENGEEIWRMQDAINRYLKLAMEDLTNLHIVPRRGLDNTLFDLPLGRPTLTPLYKQLHQQVNDLRADVLVLDNAAQVFGGNENDRGQVTRFVNAIAGLVCERPFSSVVLGHTARKEGSEFSGSAAWENACRMRWYLGASLPDQKLEADESVDPDVVYLAKRKSNYTTKDWRRLRFRNGIFVPDEPEGRPLGQGYRDDDAERVVLEAIPKLKAAGLLPTDAKNGQDYLPTQILAKGYAQGFSKKDLASAMNRLMGAGRLRRDRVGTYSNRSPRFGLVIP